MAHSIVGPVFMSYSRRDEVVMRRIVRFLRKQGIDIWVDNEKLVPGTPIWEVEIEKAIINAGAVVVLLSPDSKNSPWVRREISFAEDNDKYIFPILIAGDEKNAVPIRLTNHQRVDLRQNEELGLNSLKTAISHQLDYLETQDRRAIEEAERLAYKKVQREVIEKITERKRKPAKSTISSQFNSHIDLKTHIQNKLLTEIDLSMAPEQVQRAIQYLGEQILAEEHIILTRSERERLFAQIAAEFLGR